MQTRDISWKPADGALYQSDIRYVLMRPDVVMGTIKHVASPADLIEAMRNSAFEHAINSFNSYRETGAVENSDPVEHCCIMAGQLGWGRWEIVDKLSDGYVIDATNSPFAIPLKGVDLVMCGWITGILQAITTAHGYPNAHVDETACAAQGNESCRFTILLSGPPHG